MADSYPEDFSETASRYLAEVGAALTLDAEADRSASVNAKREQILQGAMQVFLQQGYANTSMDRVAAEAGVSKQTIYSHFQDKDGLFTALIERATIRSLWRDFQPAPFQGEPAIVLRKLAETFLAKMDDPEYIAFLRLVIAESARFPELAQLYTRTVIQYGFRCLSDYFQAHPELQIADPEATARIFMGSLVSFVVAQELLHGKHTIPIEKERIIESLMHCMLGRSQAS